MSSKDKQLSVTFIGSGDAYASGGRNQTCIAIKTPQCHLLVDCGPTTLAALKRLSIKTEQLDALLLTHGHGDHFAGIPFLLVDMLKSRASTNPFYILCPPHLPKMIQQLNALCYQNAFQKLPFELKWIELQEQPHGLKKFDLKIIPYAMKHQSNALCLGYQIHLNNKCIAFTGDTGWNENIPLLAHQSDLFITECSYMSAIDAAGKHISYEEIKLYRDKLATRHLILTHMGEDVLTNTDHIVEDMAYDGLTIKL